MNRNILAILIIVIIATKIKGNFDNNSLFSKIAAKFGYPTEENYVITKDGYVLTLFHIPGDRTRAVLLIHGNTLTGDCFIIRGKTSLAITLADQGYDVWVINMRGSRYSRRHLYLNRDTQPDLFYNYSFYEQGIYDLPATVDFILQVTGQQQVLAIGFSVGTTLLYVMGAEMPEYNDKIKLGISLAPICYLEHVRGLASIPLFLAPVMLKLFKNFEIYEIFNHEQIAPGAKVICALIGKETCINLFYTLLGYDSASFEPDFLFPFFDHFPGGTSKKILLHLLQLRQYNDFIKYDYGEEGNMAVYNRKIPPRIDLQKVTMKTALFMGMEDFLGTVEDSKRLRAVLPNVVHYQVLPYRNFSHIDFVWDRYMPIHLYPYLFPVIEKYI